MSAPDISSAPWDLATGEKWKIQSDDHRFGNDTGNEVIVDVDGTVLAYVAGHGAPDDGAMLAAAPALAEALRRLVDASGQIGLLDDHVETARRAALDVLKQAGVP